MKDLPKAELHCHLDGIVDAEMIREIQQPGSAFPLQPGDLDIDCPIHDQDSFFAWWRRLDPIQGSLQSYYPILGRHIQRLKSQNVSYSEIIITSGDIPCDSERAVDEVAMFRKWTNSQENAGIQIEFLVGLARNRSPEEIDHLADRIIELYERGLIVGVALVGPEIGNPVRPFYRTFARFHEANLGITIHAGEWCGAESVWDALDYGFPNRIGHGTHLFQDTRLVEQIQERKIHLEFCPTSNLKTGSIPGIEEHPIKRARELGLHFSINTDDPGPFACSLTGEYELVARIFGFNIDDFEAIYRNSLEARFQPALRFNTLPGEYYAGFYQK
jgi:adenosine deaminase